MTEKDLITRLTEIQEVHGWNDGQMAKRLGVDRAYWVRAKGGERGLGLKFLKGTLTAFRELKEEAVEYIVHESGRKQS